MRLYDSMIELITLRNECTNCGRLPVITAVITDHHISQNSLMKAVYHTVFLLTTLQLSQCQRRSL